jgi:microcystin-dependent protein
LPPIFTTTATGVHVPTSANDGINFVEGIKQMADEFDQLLAPIGAVHEYAGSGDPSGGKWALTDGRALSRTTYAALFSVIGTTYGSGNGTTTFNIPNTVGRTVVSPEPGGSPVVLPNSNRALGQTGGEERHNLTASESGVNGNGQTVAHAHGSASSTGFLSDSGTFTGYALATAGDRQVTQATTTASVQPGLVARAADTAHNNMQPYIVLNRIIRIA